MNRGERPAFSNRTLRAAYRVQRLLGEMGTPVVSLFTGSNSPVYHQLSWFETDINPTSIATVKTEGGDPEAGRLARNWDRCIVMAVGRRALEFSAACRSDSQEAVAFVARDVVHVGLLPEVVHFGFDYTAEKATAAMRQSRNPIEATMGRWVEEEGRLVVPADLELVDTLVPNMCLPRRHHTTPLF